MEKKGSRWKYTRKINIVEFLTIEELLKSALHSGNCGHRQNSNIYIDKDILYTCTLYNITPYGSSRQWMSFQWLHWLAFDGMMIEYLWSGYYICLWFDIAQMQTLYQKRCSLLSNAALISKHNQLSLPICVRILILFPQLLSVCFHSFFWGGFGCGCLQPIFWVRYCFNNISIRLLM